MPFDDSAPPQIFCTACGTPHHEDCYSENGGCTVFGCARAPAEEPKLQVSYSDLSAAPIARPGATPTLQPYGSPLATAAPGINPGHAAYTQGAYPLARSPRSRTAYIVLGIFLGAFGVHNFYAGYTARAVGQLCLSIFTLPFVPFLAVISWIWAVVEICIVDKDSNGLQFS